MNGLECEDHGGDGLYGSDDGWLPSDPGYGGGALRIDSARLEKAREERKQARREAVVKSVENIVDGATDIDAAGVRVDWTVGLAGSFDGNADLVCLFKNFECALFVTPGVEYGVEGGSGLTSGVLLISNIDDIEDYSGFSVTAGAEVITPVGGIEAEVSVGGEDGDMLTYYLGLGIGAQGGVHVTTSSTRLLWNMSE